MIEFKAWPKTPRLFRDVVITEKIDGTNAAIIIEESDPDVLQSNDCYTLQHGGVTYSIGAQSRRRLITPASDNFGFARWVYDNAGELVKLGPGHHYGEWWGSGIQRAYGYKEGERFFSLFNTERWADNADFPDVEGLGLVPVLYRGPFSQEVIEDCLTDLRLRGSYVDIHAPFDEWPDSEGICIFHTQSRQVYKVLLENDEISKTEAGAA